LDDKALSAILIAISARLASRAPQAPVATSDELLDAAAAASLLGVSESWLYHRPKLPFRIRVGGKLKFSRHGIERWLAHRPGC
jgi:predicted DNA-binding transcriptional regulator AlpA